MTTIHLEDVVCSNCGAQSRHPVLGSTNQFGFPDLDLRPPEMQRSTMGAWLQECPACGLVTPSLDDKSIDDQVALKSSEYLLVRNDCSLPPLARRFMCGAIISEARREPYVAFQRMLCAAWVADDANLSELARACRLKAAAYLERQSGLHLPQKAQLLDVLRRAGAWDTAETLAAELAAGGLDERMARIVAFQVTLIGRRDGSRYTVKDAIPPSPQLPKQKVPPPPSFVTRLRHWMRS